ncbi:MAG: 3-hydroxyacyl-CoA dehydrogenase family protein [Immundisolibacter sp.]|uniref:3-hydroxyacyl-CoA dehydrogenase family protein n=1 Tax=Immundisolibacter sp. TaxID=1934948 RepID=UPI003D0C0903
MDQTKPVCVIGAGFMGTVIATIYARHGYAVRLHDSAVEALASYAERATPIAESLADAAHPVAGVLGRVTPVADLAAAVDGVCLAHEVVQEDLAVKQALFERLDRLCPPQVVLGTNTSSFRLTHLCERVTHRQRVIGIHYITPAHIIRAVELIVADFTAPATLAWAQDFLASIDHVGVVCRESPGFLVNRIQLALLAEIHRIVDEGLATPEDIDAAIRLSLGPRWALWGALLCEDLVVNKRTALAVFDYMREQTGVDYYASTPTLRDMIARGEQGASTGQGWYTWDAPYADIVRERDRQLKTALDWLEAEHPVARIGVQRPDR